ncbi:MAG: OadG family protein [Clostridiales bacterium]|nr:OadG family protein [Clostridiales bacterium]
MDFRFNFDPSTLIDETLLITVKGMAGVFVVLGVIILAIYLLNKFAADKKEKQTK